MKQNVQAQIFIYLYPGGRGGNRSVCACTCFINLNRRKFAQIKSSHPKSFKYIKERYHHSRQHKHVTEFIAQIIKILIVRYFERTMVTLNTFIPTDYKRSSRATFSSQKSLEESTYFTLLSHRPRPTPFLSPPSVAPPLLSLAPRPCWSIQK